MIDMFTNYQNLSDYYVPNNLSKYICTPTSYTSKLDPTEASKPYELYDAKGNLEGYYWYKGDQVVLDFSIDGEITVECNALIFTTPGEEPNLHTEARLGQMAYNVIDFKSWKCVAYFKDMYVWELQPEFVYPLGGDKSVFIDASDYMKDKVLTFTIYNFRLEPIYNKNFEGTSSFKMYINKELSDSLNKGIYYCSLEVSGKDSHQMVFAPEDCKLLVK